ncbi:3-oxoacyl-ACP reductase [Camelimonas fluminis]|uniref:SDR family NAD(P)-dependent oxidoreductase n=1 Tax=Camelimonas fluminis TaxID=1576911 RepID=A0ABV7UI69_9HYPH|nr:SDR family oxidoreductase [Camelimonas fluminis]GHE80374.1 3-oxoacyl-ACP reductase [Camelimonas fluminis]
MDLGALIKNRHVLITGASGGLGAHFARLYASCGATVTVAARSADKLATLVTELQTQGARAHAVPLDVTSEGSIAEAFAAAEAAQGPIDVVINNAGIARPSMAMELSAEDFDDVMNTNLRGVWLVCSEAGRRWKAAGRNGVIVNIASILGFRVSYAVLPYTVSKAAVVQLTKALALEWARHGIRVNALAPGYILTDINREFFETEPGQAMIRRVPMRRLGKESELDGAVLLLSTDAGSWMTGEVIAVDGGHLVSHL